MSQPYKKKLIEVAIPLEAINKASVRENFIYRGNPSAIHKWWAQRPLAAARAVIFAQLVDDPSAHPDLFPTEKAQENERKRLFRIIEELVQWENTTNEDVLEMARREIWQSWRRACADHADHPQAKELFDRHVLPRFQDPFAGGGTLPLEAQRLGLEAHASDLNPVAVLICKLLVEVPPRFSGRPPISLVEKDQLFKVDWVGAAGLAEDVGHYAQLIVDEAERRLGHLYPPIEVTPDRIAGQPELRPLLGKALTPLAWLWARTVRSPNPAYVDVEVPIAATFLLSTKPHRPVFVEPVKDEKSYRFIVRNGSPKDDGRVKNGTKSARGASFFCLMSGVPIAPEYIYSEAKAGRMGARLMAIVAESELGRIYLSPLPQDDAIAAKADPQFRPDLAMAENPRSFSPPLYGLTTFADIFSSRQLTALSTLADLVSEVRERMLLDGKGSGFPPDERPLADGGAGLIAYADAVATLLAFAVDKTVEYGCTLVPWYAKEDRPKGIFARQAIPMVWDYAEVNPLTRIGGSFSASAKIVAGALSGCCPSGPIGVVIQRNAMSQVGTTPTIISTDPPYYDNVPYADLSDFFYVWLRRSLRPVWPKLFATVSTPKVDELVAIPYRRGGKAQAEAFFLDGMTRAMQRLAERSHPAFPVTIYYAFKQAESNGDAGSASTGWETFLDGLIRAGFRITGTWPIRTERTARSVSRNSNALASSIVLVCWPRDGKASSISRREFLAALKHELPKALVHLQRGNIAPVDLAQSAIGPGIAVFSRFASVVDAEGKPLQVRQALSMINEILDEVLAEQEGDFDADTRWALSWFEQFGFSEGEFGVAETLSKAKNTSVGGIAEAGIGLSKAGKVRLLKPEELPSDWSPGGDNRLTVWETVHHLIRTLNEGENAAAALASQLGSKAEVARELAYRLYSICERKKRAAEALRYNALVQSWPEIMRLARQVTPVPTQGGLFEEN